MAEFLHLHIEAPSDSLVHLRAISGDGQLWFALPEDLKPIGVHKHLMTIAKVKQASADCVKITTTPPKWPKYRRIRVPITTELKPLFFDEEGDLCVYGRYPEELHGEFRHGRLTKEAVNNADQSSLNQSGLNAGSGLDFKKLLERLIDDKAETKKEKELAKLKDIKNLFMVSEYDGRTNAAQWMNRFVKECERLEISDALRSEALRLFIGKNLNDWYQSNTIKLNQSDWSDWKKSFTDTYSKKGWSEIKEAYQFQYCSGSLIDYANTKERKLLEADRDMPEKYRVVQIVVGLPANVREKIDREKTTTFAELIAKLKEQNDPTEHKKHRDWKRNNLVKHRQETKIDEKVAASLFVKKKPCEFCELIGFRNNFHRVEDCKNKAKYAAATRQTKPNSHNPQKTAREVNMNELAEPDTYDLNCCLDSSSSRDSSVSGRSTKSTRSKQSNKPKNE